MKKDKELGIVVIDHVGIGRIPHLVNIEMLKDSTSSFSEVAKEIKNDTGEIPKLRICIPIALGILTSHLKTEK